MSEMSFATAVRLGSMLKPQARGALYDGKGTCAIGAALDACGLLPPVDNDYLNSAAYGDAYERWPVLTQRVVNPSRPLARSPLAVQSIVIDLVDCMGWTREEIAAWVEPIEAEYARQQAAAKEVVEV
jgi:hypothetical protein